MISTTAVLDGRYRLERLLGQGGMSDVYGAADERTGTVVAIKFVRSADPELARRFAQEVRALGRVAHPGLVRLLGTGLADGQAYLVMELVDGPTLTQVLGQGPTGPARAALLGATLADALDYVHARGIVHRDVKPSNILLGADGRPRLGDFGIARLLDASALTMAGTVLGTAAYMAPEQLEDHQVGAPADIWSLGIVLLECLTGQRTYTGSPSEVVARRLSRPVPLPADLPVPWKLLLSGMLDHRPDQRLDGRQVAALVATAPFQAPWSPAPPSPDGLAPTSVLDLTALAPGATRTARRTPPPPAGPPPAPEHQRTRGHWWPIVAGAALLATLAAALLLVFAPRHAAHPPALTSSHTRPSAAATAVTSTTSTTTTTTTIAPIAGALSALESDLANGETSGSVDPGVGQQLSALSQQAVTDAGAGRADHAASDLEQAATTLANGIQQGSIDPGEGATLQTDLSALASALGLSDAATPDTTPAAQPGPTAPGGHGHHGLGAGL